MTHNSFYIVTQMIFCQCSLKKITFISSLDSEESLMTLDKQIYYCLLNRHTAYKNTGSMDGTVQCTWLHEFSLSTNKSKVPRNIDQSQNWELCSIFSNLAILTIVQHLCIIHRHNMSVCQDLAWKIIAYDYDFTIHFFRQFNGYF